MPRILIAIIDTLANDIIGPVQVFPHEAPAIRMFGDVAKDNRTAIAAHVEDYELRCLGILSDFDLSITPAVSTIITGAQWKAAQNQTTNQETQA